MELYQLWTERHQRELAFHIPILDHFFPSSKQACYLSSSPLFVSGLMASHEATVKDATTPQAHLAASMYNDRATKYEDSWHPTFVYDFLERLNPPLKLGDNVLDLACGTGLVTFLAAARVGRFGKVFAVDISNGMLSRATERQEAGYYQHVRFYQHDIVCLDTLVDVIREKDGGGFDLITCASAFVLLDDPLAALRHWTTFLKPGGRLLVDIPHPENQIRGMLAERVGNLLNTPVPYRRAWVRGSESLKDMFDQAGLDTLSIDFVPQDGGQTRYHTLEDVDTIWASAGPPLWKTELAQKGLIDQARELFAEEAAAIAVDSRMHEVDGVFVGVAKKPIV
jgi:ubiquinone/menaquinone biosynthesis C-methylase UbiE